jgi:hypothetical protein
MARLVRRVDEQTERERESYEEGFRFAARLFFEHGVQVGREQVENEYRAAWEPVATFVRQMAGAPTCDELERRRHPHHTPEQLQALRKQARERFGLPSLGRKEVA